MSALVLIGPALAQPASPPHLEQWTDTLERRVPRAAEQCTVGRAAEMREAAEAVDQWGSEVGALFEPMPFEQALGRARRVLDVKRRVDLLADNLLAIRTQFAARSGLATQRDEVRNFLTMTDQLTDLSGRLRFQLSETLAALAELYAENDAQRTQLVETLIEYRSTIGALITVQFLFDNSLVFADERAQRELLHQRVIKLIGVSGQASLVDRLAQYIEPADRSASLVVAAAEAIRDVGIPQEVRPGTPDDLPKPAITARTLLKRLARLDPAAIDDDLATRRKALVESLEAVAARGLVEDVYRVGVVEVRPGDWLLMRNPSPFNMFTDLTPGLFTHVGVATVETGSDGIRRMVLVDMPERGKNMPATNVDIYLLRTLNYLFLRHPDSAVAEKMSDAAHSMIGNEIEFDLNFRTSRVYELQGQPLAGRKIKTYCAGLLLCCALQTDRPAAEFFPLGEYPSSERTQKNLGTLGLSIGDNFISPTGALFSEKLHVVGRREPMYDPRRDVEERIFDYFAFGMRDKTLNMKAEGLGDLRIRLAEASKGNPLLAQALAQVNQVSADLDLVSAAKAAAVIDTLDEIAFGASAEFAAAFDALRGPPVNELRRRGASTSAIEKVQKYLARHDDLLRRLIDGKLTPRQLRVELVEQYSQRGTAEMDRRFFSTGKP